MASRDYEPVQFHGNPRDSMLNNPPPTVALTTDLKERISKAVQPYPIPAGIKYQYGTAGFRMKADILPHVMFTVGLIACLRSKKRNATIGIMITASHNPPYDNGVKLVDPMGDMLEQSWEGHATVLANTENEKLVDVYASLLNETLLDQLSQHHARAAKVVLARDTRESGPPLVTALKAALDVVGVEYKDYGILTTPQLHYMVRCINTKGSQYEFGEATKEGYYQKMANAFKKAMQGRNTIGPLTIDCANGVGAMALLELIPYLPQEGDPGYLDIKAINVDMDDAKALNVECGADFVKTRQQAPKHWTKPGERARGCSLDGDADRLIYYYVNELGESHLSQAFHLMDGDRLATLGAFFLMEMTKQAKIDHKLSIGIIQTAYANGASTEYITNVLKLKALCVSTGVKHLHHAANRYDIGVYFEANGHGTILFSETAKDKIRNEEPRTPGQKTALDTLSACIDLVNQAVGDALSDMLFIELVLAAKTWSMDRWEKCYIDLPNVLKRVVVKDRSIFKTTDSERRLSSPSGIQSSIDNAVEGYQKGRAFARASGTEDAVRVYAEAYHPRDANDLAEHVSNIVTRYSEGV